MITLKYKKISQYEKRIVWTNPKCGHTQIVRYSMPSKCDHNGCDLPLDPVHRLIGESNQDCRLKYHIDGKI